MRYMKFVLMAAFAATACTDATTGEQKGGLDSSPFTPSSAAVTRDSPPLSPTMPAGIRGKWRRSTDASVTLAECVDSASTNMGLLLTIRSDGFSRFEDGGRLIRVHERDSNRIRATFDTTYADTPTQGEFLFEAQAAGQTLIERQYGDGAQLGILRYRRCPQVK